MQFIQHQIQFARPTVPAQIPGHFGAPGSAFFRFAARHLQMAELGIRHQVPINEQRTADAGAQRQNQNRAGNTARSTVAQLSKTRGIRIVDGLHGTPQTAARKFGQRLTDPGLVKIGGRAHDAVAYDAGKRQSHGMIARHIGHHGSKCAEQGVG